MGQFERLSAQDASFLYAESPVAPMHVGSLVIFEDTNLTEEQFQAHIASRLHLVPRFRKKLAWVPFGFDRPVWVDDPHFDLRFHLRYTGLPKPGGEREALRLMARIMSVPLDRQRPLWELWMFDLPDRRRGLIQKTHHCLIDGISGVDLGTVLLDLSADAPAPPAPEPWHPEPKPDKRTLFLDSVKDRLKQPKELLHTTRELRERAGEIAQGVLAFGKASLDVAPRTSLSREIGAHRRFEVVRADLGAVKEVKNRFSCTVNDVVLATVAGGLGKLLRSRGEDTAGLELRAMVPVSVRDPSQRMTYGNKVSMMTAILPVGETDARRRVELMQTRMAGLKDSKQAVGADFWVKMSDYAPPTVLALAGRAAALQRMVNLVVTNVPGPQFPLYLRGGKMLEAFPYVPLLGTASVGVAILSYNGQLNFGLTGDWDVVPDLDRFADGIRESLAELEAH